IWAAGEGGPFGALEPTLAPVAVPGNAPVGAGKPGVALENAGLVVVKVGLVVVKVGLAGLLPRLWSTPCNWTLVPKPLATVPPIRATRICSGVGLVMPWEKSSWLASCSA